jgi:hypothetical protein
LLFFLVTVTKFITMGSEFETVQANGSSLDAEKGQMEAFKEIATKRSVVMSAEKLAA